MTFQETQNTFTLEFFQAPYVYHPGYNRGELVGYLLGRVGSDRNITRLPLGSLIEDIYEGE